MRKHTNRRRAARLPVRLLAKCFVDRRGTTVVSDMWVADVNDGGLRLQSAPSHFQADQDDSPSFHRGDRVVVHHLFYDDMGPHALSGSIRWARQDAEAGTWDMGVRFQEKDRDELESFQEFLEVVRAA